MRARATRVVESYPLPQRKFSVPYVLGSLLSTNHAPRLSLRCILDLHVAGAVALVRIRILRIRDNGVCDQVLDV